LCSERRGAKIHGIMVVLRLFLVVTAILATACDQDKVAQLEKANKDLRTELDKQKQIIDLDTQGKCANAAKQYFQEEFSADSSTILLDHHSHYNKPLGKCFVMVEWHYTDKYSKTGSWYNLIKLVDAYQRDEYGTFSLYTDISIGPKFSSEERLYQCEVSGAKCTSIQQFSQFASPFMTN
jgi:hypothetical protein